MKSFVCVRLKIFFFILSQGDGEEGVQVFDHSQNHDRLNRGFNCLPCPGRILQRRGADESRGGARTSV